MRMRTQARQRKPIHMNMRTACGWEASKRPYHVALPAHAGVRSGRAGNQSAWAAAERLRTAAPRRRPKRSFARTACPGGAQGGPRPSLGTARTRPPPPDHATQAHAWLTARHETPPTALTCQPASPSLGERATPLARRPARAQLQRRARVGRPAADPAKTLAVAQLHHAGESSCRTRCPFSPIES